MKHKVLILSLDNQPQFLGGIKRVCSMLGDCWAEQNRAESMFLTFCTSELRKPKVGLLEQRFFPMPNDYAAQENVDFLLETISDGGFSILLNPHVEDAALNAFIMKVRPQVKIPVVGALHFSPTHTSDIVRRSFFNSFNLDENPLRWAVDLVLWMKYRFYGARRIALSEKKRHLEATALCDVFVLLSRRFLPSFPVKGGKIVGINNPAPYLSKDDVALDKKKKNVVWCGRLDVNGMKRCDRMLRIWKMAQKKCPDWQLLILGSGNEDRIRVLIEKHKINNAEVLGFCSPFEYYDQSSILCATSTTEGWGMVLVEAQSRGCVPMVFDSYDSVHDIITDSENGVLVSPFDLHEYAEKLIHLMKDKQLREKMAQRGLETVSRFRVDIIADEWIKLFDRLYQKQ